MEVPQNGWFRVENPIKMDDLGYPHFRKHPCNIAHVSSRFYDKLSQWTLSMSTCCLYLLEKLFEASIMMSRGPRASSI